MNALVQEDAAPGNSLLARQFSKKLLSTLFAIAASHPENIPEVPESIRAFICLILE